MKIPASTPYALHHTLKNNTPFAAFPPKKKYMSEDNQIQLFQGQQVRYIWDEEKEQYFFSVVDVIQVLTDSTTPRRYWSDLKRKLQAEGSEVYEKIVQLKLPAPDGKMRLTDVATTEQLFRLIQSVPSKKAEPLKLWLAEVGRQRLEQLEYELGGTVISNKRAIKFTAPPDELPLNEVEIWNSETLKCWRIACD